MAGVTGLGASLLPILASSLIGNFGWRPAYIVLGLTFAEALRSRHFWLITLGLGLVGIVVVGIQIHLVPMMSDRGLAPAQAALLLTVSRDPFRRRS
ncbi:hypothetical protein ABZ863_29520 [Saccharomonospora sp. NPDC046836]|uniref:hypothetical protein n=1 Tax=Saccharomonospora sp. NPDC046836 TaxID=3156921 RepID=UPI0033D5DFF8